MQRPTPETGSRDTFPPKFVHGLVRQHYAALEVKRDEMGLSNAIYLTEFWEWYVGWGTRKFKNWRWKRDGTETEDNRLWKEVQTYTAALYPRASRVICQQDPMDRGDPEVASAVLNAWWEKDGQYRTVRDCVEMAILWPGCGFKVGFEPGTANPIERTYLEPIPPWELILDRNATSIKNERFRGHVYQAPLDEILAKYPELTGKIAGTSRTDFLSGSSVTVTSGGTSTPANVEMSEDGQFVRVLEFTNFRDSVTVDGETYRGRLEVYILDQSAEVSDKPIAVVPLPMADADGRGRSNVVPLMFAHEPGYPFRPVAPVARLLPLQVTLNRLETAALGDVRRNTRKFLYHKSALVQDELDKLLNGIDMQGAAVDDELNLEAAVRMLEHQPIAADTIAYINRIDAKLQRQAGGSPNARQEITGATAYEVQTVQLFTEEGLKFHALLLSDALAEVSRLALRAIMVAGMDDGDSEGGTLAEGEELAPVGTVDVGAEMEEGDAAPMPPVKAKDWTAFPLKRDAETFTVTKEALDADFPVRFVQGERTPVSDQAMLQFLTGPGIGQYMQLFDLVIKGGHQGVIAERVMQQIAERSDLPKDLYPGALLREHREKERAESPGKGAPAPPEAQEAMDVPEEVPPAPPPVPQSGNPIMGALTTVMNALVALVTRDPAARAALNSAGMAVRQAMAAAQSGDVAGLRQAVLAASQALSAVEMDAVELDAARDGIAALVRAIARDTWPDSRGMGDVGVAEAVVE
jgi:hypothetical protein